MAADRGLSGARRWTGGRLTPQIECVLAANPGPMTLDGTNTWLLRAVHSAGIVVVDPGPDDDDHLNAVLEATTDQGCGVDVVLLTHGHADHSEGARRFATLAGAPVRAASASRWTETAGIAGADVVRAGGLRIEVIATPGHTADSLCFLIPELGAVLTGDTVLGRGSSVIAHPDGRLGDYLDSLSRLREITASAGVSTLLPGHGPPLPHPVRVIDGYLAHRHDRLDQVRAALAAGARTPADVVATVYGDVDPQLLTAAERSVLAQLEYLHVANGRPSEH